MIPSGNRKYLMKTKGRENIDKGNVEKPKEIKMNHLGILGLLEAFRTHAESSKVFFLFALTPGGAGTNLCVISVKGALGYLCTRMGRACAFSLFS